MRAEEQLRSNVCGRDGLGLDSNEEGGYFKLFEIEINCL